MTADRAGNEIELGRQAVLAAAVFDDLAGTVHGIEPIFEQGPHPLSPEAKALNYFFDFQWPAGLFKKSNNLDSAGDRVFVRLLLRLGTFLGFSLRQVLRLRRSFSIDRLRLL